MTTEAGYPGDDPRQLLSTARELTRRVRPRLLGGIGFALGQRPWRRAA